MAPKRNLTADLTPPAKSPPKKAKTPPEKTESNMNLATGATYEIRVVRCVTGANMYKVVNENDTNDAYVRNIGAEALKDPAHELSKLYKLRGELTRRRSHLEDEPLKNSKNRYDRHYFLQWAPDDQEKEIFQYNTALAIKTVSQLHSYVSTNITLTLSYTEISIQFLEIDNPYNNDYVVLKSTFDETKEHPEKFDKFIVNKDIVKVMKMRFSINSGWCNEYIETVQDYYDDLNITLQVRALLGWTTEEP